MDSCEETGGEMRGVISFTGSDENNAYIPMTFNIRDTQLEKGLPIAFSLSRSSLSPTVLAKFGCRGYSGGGAHAHEMSHLLVSHSF
jgi:hypothetical protein